MKAIIDGDLVVGFGDGDVAGIDVPEEFRGLPAERIRYASGELVDISEVQEFFVDRNGVLHVVDGDGRKAITCEWNAQLVCDKASGTWRARTVAEVVAPAIKQECQRRIYAEIDAFAQANLSAERHRLTSEEQATYDAGLDWIRSMRSKCVELIGNADATFRDDSHWPDVPDGVAALAERF